MENLYYNLSEEEFSKSKKIMLWVFASIFFITGLTTVVMNLVFHDNSINIAVSAAPFSISIVVGIIAGLATFKRTDHYFIIDNEKIEFLYGIVNPKSTTYAWNDIAEIHFPHKQKKIKLIMKNHTEAIINLNWIQKKKSSHIRKHIYYFAKEKNIEIIKTQVLAK